MRKLLISFVVLMSLVLGASFAMAKDLTLGLKGEPTSLDPHFHNVTSNNQMAIYVFDKLILQDERQKMQPGLAVSWKPVADTVWEFKLREGVKFHDGSPFTAEDVKYTIERIPTVPNSPSSFTFAVSAITEVEIVDPLTVRVHTEKPSPLMPRNFAAFTIVSKKAAEGKTTEDFNSGAAPSAPVRTSWPNGPVVTRSSTNAMTSIGAARCLSSVSSFGPSPMTVPASPRSSPVTLI